MYRLPGHASERTIVAEHLNSAGCFRSRRVVSGRNARPRGTRHSDCIASNVKRCRDGRPPANLITPLQCVSGWCAEVRERAGKRVTPWRLSRVGYIVRGKGAQRLASRSPIATQMARSAPTGAPKGLVGGEARLDTNRLAPDNGHRNEPPQSGRCWSWAENARTPQALPGPCVVPPPWGRELALGREARKHHPERKLGWE